MTGLLRVLTVRQPWAWAIIHGGKTVENRPRNIVGDYRGPVAIHVSQSIDTDAMLAPSQPLKDAAALYTSRHPSPLAGAPWFSGRGAIIGVVDLVEVHHFAECVFLRTTWQSADPNDADLPGGTPIEQEVEKCSRWAEEGEVYHLTFANPRPLASPIPFKGGLGLRWLPDEVAGRVLAGATT